MGPERRKRPGPRGRLRFSPAGSAEGPGGSTVPGARVRTRRLAALTLMSGAAGTACFRFARTAGSVDSVGGVDLAPIDRSSIEHRPVSALV